MQFPHHPHEIIHDISPGDTEDPVLDYHETAAIWSRPRGPASVCARCRCCQGRCNSLFLIYYEIDTVTGDTSIISPVEKLPSIRYGQIEKLDVNEVSLSISGFSPKNVRVISSIR